MIRPISGTLFTKKRIKKSVFKKFQEFSVACQYCGTVGNKICKIYLKEIKRQNEKMPVSAFSSTKQGIYLICR